MVGRNPTPQGLRRGPVGLFRRATPFPQKKRQANCLPRARNFF
jgi:hypothetical protein